MADSLREQLVKAGLATREQADRLEQPARRTSKSKGDAASKRRGAKNKRKKKPQHNAGPRANQPVAAKKGQKTPEAPDAELLQRRRIKAEIKALIEAASVKDFVGEVSFNFMIGERIRQIFVTESAQKSIVAGELAITRLNRETHLIPPETAKQVKALNPNWLIVLNGEASGDAEPVHDPDDPYTEYTVPDDLHW